LHVRRSIDDTHSYSLDRKIGAAPFHLFQLPISNYCQKWPPVICGGDCQQKNAFEDATFCLDERPRKINLDLDSLGLLHIGTHSFAMENRNSLEDKTYHFDY
jgi:hypothetical protein